MIFLFFSVIPFLSGCEKAKSKDEERIISLNCELDRPNSICIDDKDIFWIDMDYVAKISKNGGDPIKLAGTVKPFSSLLTIDESFVYWSEDEDNIIKRVSKEGGKVDTLLTAEFEILDLCADEDAVYAKARGFDPTFSGVVKIQKDNGMPFLLANVGWDNYERGIILDNIHVYWGNSRTGTIYRVSIKGGIPLPFVNDIDGPFTQDSDYFYWIYENNLYRKSKEGGSSTLLGNFGEYLQDYDATISPGGIKVDETNIYIIYGGIKGETVGLIKKMPKVSGPVTIMYSELPEPRGLCIDDRYLYWGDMKRDTHYKDCIIKAPK